MNETFIKLLEQQLKDAGRDLNVSARDVAAYASQRAAHLSTLVADPNFMDAVKAERDNVALYAGIKAVENADAIDNRVLGIIQGAIALGAGLL